MKPEHPEQPSIATTKVRSHQHAHTLHAYIKELDALIQPMTDLQKVMLLATMRGQLSAMAQDVDDTRTISGLHQEAMLNLFIVWEQAVLREDYVNKTTDY